jgi:hypothetical protein
VPCAAGPPSRQAARRGPGARERACWAEPAVPGKENGRIAPRPGPGRRPVALSLSPPSSQPRICPACLNERGNAPGNLLFI